MYNVQSAAYQHVAGRNGELSCKGRSNIGKKTLRLQNKVFVNGITAMLKKDFRTKKG